MGAEVVEEYVSSLTDLTVNSKPLINMLTMLAEENSAHAAEIVHAIEAHIDKVSVEIKLPILYLIDSIVKNVKDVYAPLFTNNIVQIFASVFEKADEKTRLAMYKLRGTWNDIFPPKKMYTLDLRIQHIDQNWPIQSPPPTSIHVNPKRAGVGIHVNRNFVGSSDVGGAAPAEGSVPPVPSVNSELEATYLKKQLILQELQKKKKELEEIQQKVLFGDSIPQATVRPFQTDGKPAKAVTVPKMIPRAVIIPPLPTAQPKPKIAPANSELIAAAKSRDPRLARAQVEEPEAPPVRSKDPRMNKTKDPRMVPRVPKSPKPKEQPKKKRTLTKEKVSESEDLVEDLIKMQTVQMMPSPPKAADKVAPQVKNEEDLIQQRQLAMLKAPVQGQIKRKTSESEKPKRKRSPRPKEAARNPSPPPRSRAKSKSREKQREIDEILAIPVKPSGKFIPVGGDSPVRSTSPSDEVISLYVNPTYSPVRESSPKDTEILMKYTNPSRSPPARRSLSPRFSPELDTKRLGGDQQDLRKRVLSPKFSPEPDQKKSDFKISKPVEVVVPSGRRLAKAPARKIQVRLTTPKFSPEPEEKKKSPKTTWRKVPQKSVVAEEFLEPIESSPSPEPPPPPDIGPNTFDVQPMDVDDDAERLSPVGFKTVKVRSRNYSRRNKDRSPTPPADPEPVPVKPTPVDDVKDTVVDMGDVDLRVLPREAITKDKKRPSIGDTEDEPPNKKGKTNEQTMLEKFSMTDTDMRQRPAAAASPPPPPPPVISSPSSSPTKTETKARPTLSEQLEMRVADFEKAERERGIPPESPTGQRDGLGRLRLYSKLPGDPRARRDSTTRQDARLPQDVRFDDIVRQAKEQFDRGVMTQNQYNELLAQIFRMNEDQKIREAQRQRRVKTITLGAGGPPFDSVQGRPFFQGPDARNGAWDPRMQGEDGGFSRRWRGRGGMRGRAGSAVAAWNRFQPAGGNSPDWGDSERSQEAWVPPLDLQSLPVIGPTDSMILDAINRDPSKSISIDGHPRRIRFYGQIAVALLSFSCAREISFENGMRRVFIAGLDIPCQLNGPIMPFLFQQATHTVRLGAPTRELYLDDKYYEVAFGGPPVQAELAGIPCPVQVEGPSPTVRIAQQPTDLCLGFVFLIVDARTSFQIYLDAKPQRFEILKRPLVIRFVDKLRTVLINDVSVPLRFGGEPVAVNFCDQQHFLRMTELPPGIVPGRVHVRHMEGIKDSPPHLQDNNSMDAIHSETPTDRGMYEEMASTMMGPAAETQQVGFNYTVDAASVPAPAPAPVVSEPAQPVQFDISNLFKSLLNSGIISKPAVPVSTPPQPSQPVHRVDLRDNSTLYIAQPGLVELLTSGMQCASCGVRFLSEDTSKYSQHLDWHFRQNRRDKDSLRRGSSRKWYYDLSDWIQFEEIEDLEQRAQSWFETENTTAEGDAEREAELRSEPAPADTSVVSCHVCRDTFDTFFNEETEEWHLRKCTKVDGIYYHPLCYEDSLKTDSLLSLEKVTSLPLLAPLKEEVVPKVDESVLVLDIDEDDKDDDMEDVEVVTADFDAIQELMANLVDQVIADEECQKLEDDELEVLSVNEKEEKPPVEVIDVYDDPNIVFGPPSPEVFDPNKKIKDEPADDLDMEKPVAQVDQTIANVTSSIDGNIEMAETTVVSSGPTVNKIKITFTKAAIAAPAPKKTVPVVDDTPIDPSELQEIVPEPMPVKPKKPRLANRNLSEFPPVQRGTEFSGLCSIM